MRARTHTVAPMHGLTPHIFHKHSLYTHTNILSYRERERAVRKTTDNISTQNHKLPEEMITLISSHVTILMAEEQKLCEDEKEKAILRSLCNTWSDTRPFKD